MVIAKEMFSLATTSGDFQLVPGTATRLETASTSTGRAQHGRESSEAQKCLLRRKPLNLPKHSSTKENLVLVLLE